MKLFDLTGRKAVVVGATSGIGRRLALGLAGAGADVVGTGRRLELCETLAAEIGGRSFACAVDVQDGASVAAFGDRVLAEFGGVDILLNAAGVTKKTPTAEVSEEEWERIFDIDLTGVLRCCQAFYAPLKASDHARVINIASVASGRGFFQVAAYAAAKAGVVSLTQTLAVEWAIDGINANALLPGVFRTDLNAALLDGTERGREFKMRTPMGRFGQIDELVGAAIFLASDAASFVTGASLVVDGGFLASGVNT